MYIPIIQSKIFTSRYNGSASGARRRKCDLWPRKWRSLSLIVIRSILSTLRTRCKAAELAMLTRADSSYGNARSNRDTRSPFAFFGVIRAYKHHRAGGEYRGYLHGFIFPYSLPQISTRGVASPPVYRRVQNPSGKPSRIQDFRYIPWISSSFRYISIWTSRLLFSS